MTRIFCYRSDRRRRKDKEKKQSVGPKTPLLHCALVLLHCALVSLHCALVLSNGVCSWNTRCNKKEGKKHSALNLSPSQLSDRGWLNACRLLPVNAWMLYTTLRTQKQKRKKQSVSHKAPLLHTPFLAHTDTHTDQFACRYILCSQHIQTHAPQYSGVHCLDDWHTKKKEGKKQSALCYTDNKTGGQKKVVKKSGQKQVKKRRKPWPW